MRSQEHSASLSASVVPKRTAHAPPRRRTQWSRPPAPASQCPCAARCGPRPLHAVAASPAAAAAARTLQHAPLTAYPRQQRSESSRRAERPCATSLDARCMQRCSGCAGSTERAKLCEWQSGVLVVAVRSHGHGARELRHVCSGGVVPAAGWRVLVTVPRLLCHRPHLATSAQTPQPRPLGCEATSN